MKLCKLLSNVQIEKILNESDLEISNIFFDSRNKFDGGMFVAQRGYNLDGHQYISKAVENGAKCVVCEELPIETNEHVVYVLVKDSSMALAAVANNFYDRPSEKLKLVGVTGTNGKTTTATLLYDMVRLDGKKAGLLSTVCNYVDGKAIHASHTTPDALAINKLLGEMVDAGCEYCFMEVSSHSSHQNRIAFLDFDGAIFSNITHDHLDYHKTFKAYIEAKKHFFDMLKKNAFAITNSDDKNGMVMLQNTKAQKLTYSCRTMADFNCKIIEKHLNGTLLKLDGREVWTNFTGNFNAYNILAVYSALMALGFDKDCVLKNLSIIKPVAGRFETISSEKGFVVVVDYAHTPDAVDNVLSSLAECKNTGRILTVIGAGGDRDKTKRPEMADVSCRKSDVVILTSDNPRSENPEDIIEDMKKGVPENFEYKVISVVNRKDAIFKALSMAAKGDVILIAGKGHEDYQEIKGVKYHFDDREIVREYLAEN